MFTYMKNKFIFVKQDIDLVDKLFILEREEFEIYILNQTTIENKTKMQCNRVGIRAQIHRFKTNMANLRNN